MRSPRGMSQVRVLGQQIGQMKCLFEAYKDATSESFSYLVVDLSPKSDDNYRFRTKIFTGEDTIFYVDRKRRK